MNRLFEIKGYALVGVVVSQASLVEGQIDTILTNFYSNSTDEGKGNRNDSLSSNKLTLSSKYELLTKIAKQKGITTAKSDRGNFRDWKKIRNIIAHGKPGIDQESKRYAIEHNGQHYFLDDLIREFGKLQDNLRQYLSRF